ncbi:hypothetical protein BCR43DRAFT_497044 [Syncephalastrum racemosum]|uniref:Uncharacterized protein n=1 Tax=Syncephalastrum racemosum TaxID=13706 RepID=A0A1X2H514_SYNRA|nr:hypothetical protein BCR43DRAFT_497044 [Syncephalastrum racemosum]
MPKLRCHGCSEKVKRGDTESHGKKCQTSFTCLGCKETVTAGHKHCSNKDEKATHKNTAPEKAPSAVDQLEQKNEKEKTSSSTDKPLSIIDQLKQKKDTSQNTPNKPLSIIDQLKQKETENQNTPSPTKPLSIVEQLELKKKQEDTPPLTDTRPPKVTSDKHHEKRTKRKQEESQPTTSKRARQ